MSNHRRRRFQMDGERYWLPIRDSQRSRLYQAEQTGYPYYTHASFEEGQARVDEIVRSSFYRKLAKRIVGSRPRDIILQPSRSVLTARSLGGVIRIHKDRLTDRLIIHELAHEILPDFVQHHWPFAQVYAMLLERFVSDVAADMLRLNYQVQKVQFGPPER